MKESVSSSSLVHPILSNVSSSERLVNNCHIAPNFEPMRILQDLNELVNGGSTSIEQSYLYVTDRGALGWHHLAHQEDYFAAQNTIPLKEIAETLQNRLKKSSFQPECIDILALGSGEARQERGLAQFVWERTSIQSVGVYLFDISQVLLNTAYSQTVYTIGHFPGISITAVQGDFFHLSRYNRLVESSIKHNRMRLVTLLGATFGNLESEKYFVKNVLKVFPPGTLFMMDMMLPYADPEDSEKIVKSDPWLAKKTHWWKNEEEFLSAPFRTFRDGLQPDSIRFYTALDETLVDVPQSYAIEMRAVVEEKYEFGMQRFKRYEIEGLQKFMARHQWILVNSFPYTNANRRRTVCLFQKQ